LSNVADLPLNRKDNNEINSSFQLPFDESLTSDWQETDIDSLVQQLQEQCRQKLLNQHTRMRLLSGEEIETAQLYVDVWLLSRSPRTYQVSQSKLLEKFDLRNDRLGLGDRIKRIPGFKVTNEKSKLIILGKPGSGKTTLLKHLAVDWCKGNFYPNLIAVLIEFRQIQDEQWHLLDALHREVGLKNWKQVAEVMEKIRPHKKIIIQKQERFQQIQVWQHDFIKSKKQLQELQKSLKNIQENSEKLQDEIQKSLQIRKIAEQEFHISKNKLELKQQHFKNLEQKYQKLKTDIEVSQESIQILEEFEESEFERELSQQDIKRLENDLEESKNREKAIKNQEKVLKNKSQYFQEEIQKVQLQIKASLQQIEAFPYTLDELEQEIAVLEQEIIDLEKEIEVKQQEIEVLRQPLKALLKQGKLLILMDGLDEVSTNKLRRDFQDQLRQITQEYPKNRFLLTCRTQIIEYIPTGFTSVEVADFNMEQVKQFFKNWLMANGKSNTEAEQQWEIFNNTVANNPAMKELTATPVLLSLMCLVFQDEGEMPSQMTWLYQKGIKLLLSKWNGAKEINKWEVGSDTYRKLSFEQKEALLNEIAARKFEDPNNFVLFEQQEIADYITKFLQLTSPKEGVEVLKAIEAQHGLLVERADELWSFSHLTFQEHFTVQWLTQLPSKTLAEKIGNEQWQEVVKQIVKSQQPADRLLRLIKQAIDYSISNESRLQHFLKWLLQKSASYQGNYKSTAIRVFYFAFTLAFDFAHNLDLALARAQDLNYNLELSLARAHAQDLEHAYDSACSSFICAQDLSRAVLPDFDFPPEPVNQLKKIMVELPRSSTKDWQSFKSWWQEHGKDWTKQLRNVRRYYNSINHNLEFNSIQKKQLQRYYDANKFLVDLMNIPGAISNNVRIDIQNTLLLPCKEFQNQD
jgi:predicted NACHT family NTPase